MGQATETIMGRKKNKRTDGETSGLVGKSLDSLCCGRLFQVSPIMGPVLAFTFGTNVRDWSLAKKGFLVEVSTGILRSVQIV